MKISLRNISSLVEAQHELKRLGVDSAGVGIMAKKMIMKTFFLEEMSVRAANILKQECIAVGADLALPKEASFLEGVSTNAVLMVNESQLEMLLLNLRAQPFGLREVGERLKEILRSVKFMYHKPKIIGVVNVTPDSFSDGGKFFVGGKLDTASVLRACEIMIEEGADYLDIGGESTGPGSVGVSAKEEMARLQPVFELLAKKKLMKKVRVSVDTYRANVAEMALGYGAMMVNDVTALRGDKKIAAVVARAGAELVLMYAKDPTARTTKDMVSYEDVVETVREFLEQRITYAVTHGIVREKLWIDPGMGAFVSGEPKYSFEILKRLRELTIFGLPILVGTSKKSFLGGKVDERQAASLASSNMAYINGAAMLRVHDVAQARQSLDTVFHTVS